MYSALFLFQAALQMALFVWLWRLWRERGGRAVGSVVGCPCDRLGGAVVGTRQRG